MTPEAPDHTTLDPELAAAIRRLEIIVSAGRVLAGSLDLGILDRFARLIVPAVADVCAIDLIDRHGSARRVAAVHADPAREPLVREMERFLPSMTSHPRVADSVETGASVLAPEIDEDLLLGYTDDPEYASLVRALAIRSGMVVPLYGRTRTIGVMTLAQSESGRRFGEDDLRLVEDLGRQVALAAENAMLFRDVEESSERYRQLVDTVDAIVWEADADPMRFTFVSERARTILGYDPARWISDPDLWQSLLHPDDRGPAMDRRIAATKAGEDHELEFRMVAADDRVVWMHERVFVLTGDDGRATVLRGIMVDVTERKLAEVRQRAQLAATRVFAEVEGPTEIPARILVGLLDTLSWDAAAVWEFRGGTLRCTEFAARLGVHVPEFEAATWRSSFIRSEGLPGRVLASAEPVWIEDITVERGSPRAPAARASGLRSGFAFPILAEGRVRGVLEFFTRQHVKPDDGLLQLVGTVGAQMGQFIGRRELAADLRLSEARTRAVMDSALDAIVTMDRDGVVTSFNPAACELFGYRTEDAVGRTVAELIVPPALRDRHLAGLTRYLRTGTSDIVGGRLEMQAMRADGSEFPAEVTIGVREEIGQPTFIGFVRDLTERRTAELRRMALHDMTSALAESETVEQAAERILCTICGALGWSLGMMYQVDPDGHEMRFLAAWADDPNLASFVETSRQTVFVRDEGTVGRTWTSQEPLWLRDALDDSGFVRAPAAATVGLRSILDLPVKSADTVVGVMEFFSHTINEPDDDLLRLLEGACIQIGGFIGRQRSQQMAALRGALLASQSESSLDGVLVVAPDGRTLARTQRFMQLWNIPEDVAREGGDAAVVRAVLDRLADPETTLRKVRHLNEHPDLVDREEVALKDGRIFDCHTAPVVGEDGTTYGRAWSFRDITDERRLQRALEESNVRASFLTELSTALVGTLETREMLARVTRMAVPAVADWCAVDLIAPDGTLDRVAVAHHDERKAPLLEEMRGAVAGLRLDPAATHGLSHVILTGHSELEPDVPGAWVDNIAWGDERYRRALKSLGLRSYICVPLIARGRTIGAITFVTAESARRYRTADLWLAEDVARRAAMALENARLYEESAHVAQTLQASLIPPALPEIQGLEIAARFRPGGRGLQVGGDFYDIFSTGRGEWAVAMGDVCGKGADAAAVTALARYTIRAAAMESRRPRAILSRLNEALLRQRADDRFCTVAYARVRTGEGAVRMTISSAGHPIPLVLRANGTIEAAGAPGMLLGAFEDVRLLEHSMTLEQGDLLLLYTDGVTEAGRGGTMLGDEGLATLLTSCSSLSAEAVASRVEEAALERTRNGDHDDIAIVALRVARTSGRDPAAGKGRNPVSPGKSASG